MAAGAVGTLMVVKGKVWIIDGKGKKSKARVGKKIKAKDTIECETDSRAKLVMLDKNIIHISPESKISLAKYEFDPKAKKKDVLIDVLYGKVRSNVKQKYDGDQSKFQVKTKAAVAGVRGTDFLGGYNAKSNKAQFVTFSGAVEVGTVGKNGKIINAVILPPGQMVTAGNGQINKPEKVSKQDLNDMNNDSSGGEERLPADDGGPSIEGGGDESGDQGGAEGDQAGVEGGSEPSLEGEAGMEGPEGEGGMEMAGPEGEGGMAGPEGDGGMAGPEGGDSMTGGDTMAGGEPGPGPDSGSMIDFGTEGGSEGGMNELIGLTPEGTEFSDPTRDLAGDTTAILPPPLPPPPPEIIDVPEVTCPPICPDLITGGKTRLIIDIK
jgi:hypothetical protein